MVKLGMRSPAGKYGTGNKFVSWKRGKSAKTVDNHAGDNGNGGGAARTDPNATAATVVPSAKEEVEQQVEVVANAVDVSPKIQQRPPTPTTPLPKTTPPNENLATPVVMTKRSRSIKSIVSLKSTRSRKSKAGNAAAMKLIEEKAAAIPKEVPIVVLAPIVDATPPPRSDLSTKSGGSAKSAKKRYVPLQQRLKEREQKMQANKDAQPTVTVLRRKKWGINNAENECGAVECGEMEAMKNAMSGDNLENFREFVADRVCSPTGNGDDESFGSASDEDFVLNTPVQEKKNKPTRWSPAAWLSSDLICSPIDCLNINNNDDRSVQSDTSLVAAHARPFLQEGTSQSQEDSPSSASLFARVAPAVTFPPATSEKKTRAAAYAKRAKKQAVEKARKGAAKEARRAAQLAMEEARALAAEETKRVREKAEMKIAAYSEELKWMEANLDYESQQNSALNVQVAQLKHDIITTQDQLRKDMSIAHNEAQNVVNARNDEIKKMEQAITTLKISIDHEKTHRDEAMQSAQADAQNTVEARNYEIKQMEEVIATLRLNIKTERRHREDAEKIVQDKVEETERINEIQGKALRNMEANLNAENLQNLALNADLAELKSEILVAKAKQQAMDEVNACLAEEALSAKKTAELEINAQTEALKKMEANWKMESKQNAGLNAHIAQLKHDIDVARMEQEALDEEAKTVKEVAELKILTQTEALRKVESKLKLESKQNSALDARIDQLNKSIYSARAKQEALDEEACRVKDHAEVRINAQTEALKKMEVNWNSESKENDALTAQITQLKKDIVDAKAEQEAVDLARARSAEGALKTREQAEVKTNAQSDELKKMEDKLKSESKTNSALHAQMTLLKSDNAQLKKVMSFDRKDAQKTIGAQNEELKKVAQLKSDNAQLKKVMSTDRKGAQKTIDAQNEELKKVENAILRLKANIAREYKLRDEAVVSKSGAEVALQKKIDLISQEILGQQNKYAEKVEIVRSMSVDSTHPQTTYNEDENAIEVAFNGEEEETLAASEEGDPEELEEEEEEENSTASEDVDELRNFSFDRAEVEMSGNTSCTSASFTIMARGGKKTGWFRKFLSHGSNTDDDISMASSVMSECRRGKRAGSLRSKLRSKKWMSPSNSRSSRWTRRSFLSEDSMEDDDDEFAEESADDEDTYASANAGQSYSISYSESVATFESVKAVETDCSSASGGTAPSASEAAPEKSPKTGGKGGGSGSVGIKCSKSVGSTMGESLQKTASSGSEQTDRTSSSNTLSETDIEDKSTMTETPGDTDIDTAPTVAKPTTAATRSGVMMSWFGSAKNDNKKQRQDVTLDRVNSGFSILVQ